MEFFRSGAPLSMLDCIFEEEETESGNASDAVGNGPEQQANLEEVLRHLTCTRTPQGRDANRDSAAPSASRSPREGPRRPSRSERYERRVLDCLQENLEAIAEIGTPQEGKRCIFRVLTACRKKTRRMLKTERHEKLHKRPDSFRAAIEKFSEIRDMLQEHDQNLSRRPIRTNFTQLELRKEFDSTAEKIRRRLLLRSEREAKQRREWMEHREKLARDRC